MLSGNGRALFNSEANIAQTTPHGGDYAGPEQITAGSSCHWFAVYTSSHHEKRVAEQLAQRQMESFLPLYSTTRRWKNRTRVTLELPLFPGYLFARIERKERVRLLEIPGVLSLVGFGQQPAPLPDFEIESLRSGLRQRTIGPHPYLVMGERFRIKTGAMAGMEGVLVRQKNNFRIVITLDMIMRSVAVEVDADDLEPVAHPRPLQATVHRPS